MIIVFFSFLGFINGSDLQASTPQSGSVDEELIPFHWILPSAG